jgi:hypothetical protein
VYNGGEKKWKPKVAELGPKWRTKEKKYSLQCSAGTVIATVCCEEEGILKLMVPKISERCLQTLKYLRKEFEGLDKQRLIEPLVSL